jgi:hypothetical protein
VAQATTLVDALSPAVGPAPVAPEIEERVVVPESKSRKKKPVSVDPAWAARQAEAAAKEAAAAEKGNPAWLVPVMLGLMVLGLVWIVVYYLTAARVGGGFPVPAIRQWNIAVGFALIIGGFALTTRWK